MVRELKTKKPGIRELVCLVKLREEDLRQGNLKNHKRQLCQQFESIYDEFLIIVRSDSGKEFAFYIPHKFEETKYIETE